MATLAPRLECRWQAVPSTVAGARRQPCIPGSGCKVNLDDGEPGERSEPGRGRRLGPGLRTPMTRKASTGHKAHPRAAAIGCGGGGRRDKISPTKEIEKEFNDEPRIQQQKGSHAQREEGGAGEMGWGKEMKRAEARNKSAPLLCRRGKRVQAGADPTCKGQATKRFRLGPGPSNCQWALSLGAPEAASMRSGRPVTPSQKRRLIPSGRDVASNMPGSSFHGHVKKKSHTLVCEEMPNPSAGCAG